MAVSEKVFEEALKAYGETKSHKVDRKRLRRALEAATQTAHSEGYQKGLEAGEYSDGGVGHDRVLDAL
jgi:Ca2+-binding EF-hand superfamily protein